MEILFQEGLIKVGTTTVCVVHCPYCSVVLCTVGASGLAIKYCVARCRCYTMPGQGTKQCSAMLPPVGPSSLSLAIACAVCLPEFDLPEPSPFSSLFLPCSTAVFVQHRDVCHGGQHASPHLHLHSAAQVGRRGEQVSGCWVCALQPHRQNNTEQNRSKLNLPVHACAQQYSVPWLGTGSTPISYSCFGFLLLVNPLQVDRQRRVHPNERQSR